MLLHTITAIVPFASNYDVGDIVLGALVTCRGPAPEDFSVRPVVLDAERVSHDALALSPVFEAALPDYAVDIRSVRSKLTRAWLQQVAQCLLGELEKMEDEFADDADDADTEPADDEDDLPF